MAEHDLGHPDQARRTLKTHLDAHHDDSPYAIASAYAWCGETEQAFEWLTRAIAQQDEGVQYLKYDPLLRSIRDDPRYAELLKTMKLSE